MDAFECRILHTKQGWDPPVALWTDLAHGLGYHDQMHVVRDFKHLSGNSPTAISGHLDMFVQPELISAVDRKL